MRNLKPHINWQQSITQQRDIDCLSPQQTIFRDIDLIEEDYPDVPHLKKLVKDLEHWDWSRVLHDCTNPNGKNEGRQLLSWLSLIADSAVCRNVTGRYDKDLKDFCHWIYIDLKTVLMRLELNETYSY